MKRTRTVSLDTDWVWRVPLYRTARALQRGGSALAANGQVGSGGDASLLVLGRNMRQDGATVTVDARMGAMKKEWDEYPEVLDYLKAVHDDVIENVDDFRPGGDRAGQLDVARQIVGSKKSLELRYAWTLGGGLPDVAVHHLDPAFYALALDTPETVEATAPDVDEEVASTGVLATWRFGRRFNMEPVSVFW